MSVMEHHEVPFGIWLAVSDDGEPLAHWYVLQDPSRVDINRNAIKAVLASEIAQAIHEHVPGDICRKECKVLLPGPEPYDGPDLEETHEPVDIHDVYEYPEDEPL